jgi:hypothetical protein
MFYELRHGEYILFHPMAPRPKPSFESIHPRINKPRVIVVQVEFSFDMGLNPGIGPRLPAITAVVPGGGNLALPPLRVWSVGYPLLKGWGTAGDDNSALTPLLYESRQTRK